MSVPTRRFLRLLALLLLTQWVAGLPAHARAMAKTGDEVVICTPEGMRTIHLGPDGQPVAPQDPSLGCCLLCPGPAAGGMLASGPSLGPPTLISAVEASKAATVRSLALRPPPRIHHSRAPPIS